MSTNVGGAMNASLTAAAIPEGQPGIRSGRHVVYDVLLSHQRQRRNP